MTYTAAEASALLPKASWVARQARHREAQAIRNALDDELLAAKNTRDSVPVGTTLHAAAYSRCVEIELQIVMLEDQPA